MPAKTAAPQARPTKAPPMIREIGADDFSGSKGFLKILLLAAKDAGKTRWSSAWPTPIYLECEPGLGSIAKRRINYDGELRPPRAMRVKDSADMMNAINYLETQGCKHRGDKPPKYQTVVVDTLDAFSREVKDEWLRISGEAVFTGHDAWGYLESKMNAALTRLMNLDANVIILCHWRDREITDPDNKREKITIYEPLLQGQVKDSIFQDFDLVGWMEKYDVAGSDGEREERRGITFQSSTQRPFLADRFGLIPPGIRELGKMGKVYWPVEIFDGTDPLHRGDPETFEAVNFAALWTALLEHLEDLPDTQEVEQVPDTVDAPPPGDKAMPPGQGGPVPPQKQTAAKQAAKPAAKKVAPAPGGQADPTPPASPEPSSASSSGTSSSPDSADASSADATDAAAAASEPATDDAGAAVGPAGDPAPTAGAADESAQAVTPVGEQDGSTSEPTAEATGDAEPSMEQAVATVQEQLDAEVVTDTPAAEADNGNRCPICNKDMAGESGDLVQLSRLQHRKLRLPDGVEFYETGGCCNECRLRLNDQKSAKSGLYDPAENPAMAS